MEQDTGQNLMAQSNMKHDKPLKKITETEKKTTSGKKLLRFYNVVLKYQGFW